MLKPTVDHYMTDRDGVWHPDALSLRMGSGSAADGVVAGSGSWLNPWAAIPERQLVDAFTQSLPGAAAKLQWALPLYADVAADRGNLAIARQDEKPSWLSKPAFLEFGALRAFPLLQAM